MIPATEASKTGPESSSFRSRRKLALPVGTLTLADVVLGLGCAAIILPTMVGVAKFSWSTEQGGHGPIVLATGIWLLLRELKTGAAVQRPGSVAIGGLWLFAMLAIFVIARITGILEVDAFAMYGALIAAAYLLSGAQMLRSIWFPLVYLAFTLPPPDSVVAAVTQPIKIAISTSAVSLLHTLGYPIASSGVTIQIAQYELLVAAACAGLNSIVTLGALCLFYVYLRHRSNPKAFLLVCIAVIPVAVFANFVRVLVLVLVTYYFGEAAAQGFVHDLAGLLLFSVALATIFMIDWMANPLLRASSREKLIEQA
jgi:exosortase